MEFFKALFAAVFVLTTLSSVAWTAPMSSRPNDAEIFIRLVLNPARANATTEMLNVYQLIASNWDLKETPLALGVADTPTCSSNMEKKDNLSIAFIHLHNFMNPLYMAYSYEEAKEPQHKLLTSVLKATSRYLNTTVFMMENEILKNGYQVPTVQHESEEQLNHYTRGYLEALVRRNSLSRSITDDVVKTYRNYVLLYTLKNVIAQEVLTCI